MAVLGTERFHCQQWSEGVRKKKRFHLASLSERWQESVAGWNPLAAPDELGWDPRLTRYRCRGLRSSPCCHKIQDRLPTADRQPLQVLGLRIFLCLCWKVRAGPLRVCPLIRNAAQLVDHHGGGEQAVTSQGIQVAPGVEHALGDQHFLEAPVCWCCQTVSGRRAFLPQFLCRNGCAQQHGHLPRAWHC